FHEDRDASSGRDGHADEGDPQSEDLVELDVEAQALVLARGVPAFELDYQLDALGGSRRRDPEEIHDVDDADAAQLHVVPRQLWAGADQDRFRPAANLDGIVGHQSMATHNQVERAFALADSALTGDE